VKAFVQRVGEPPGTATEAPDGLLHTARAVMPEHKLRCLSLLRQNGRSHEALAAYSPSPRFGFRHPSQAPSSAGSVPRSGAALFWQASAFSPWCGRSCTRPRAIRSGLRRSPPGLSPVATRRREIP